MTAPTEASPLAGLTQLAYSLEPPEPLSHTTTPTRRSWRQAADLAGIIVLAGVATAASVWVLARAVQPGADPMAIPAASAPAAPDDVVVQPGPWIPPVTPGDAQHLPTGAALFTVLLSRVGITPLDPGTAEASANAYGRGVCAQLAQGYTVQDEVDAMEGVRMGDGKVPTPVQAWAIVHAAEQVYCPHG